MVLSSLQKPSISLTLNTLLLLPRVSVNISPTSMLCSTCILVMLAALHVLDRSLTSASLVPTEILLSTVYVVQMDALTALRQFYALHVTYMPSGLMFQMQITFVRASHASMRTPAVSAFSAQQPAKPVCWLDQTHYA